MIEDRECVNNNITDSKNMTNILNLNFILLLIKILFNTKLNIQLGFGTLFGVLSNSLWLIIFCLLVKLVYKIKLFNQYKLWVYLFFSIFIISIIANQVAINLLFIRRLMYEFKYFVLLVIIVVITRLQYTIKNVHFYKNVLKAIVLIVLATGVIQYLFPNEFFTFWDNIINYNIVNRTFRRVEGRKQIQGLFLHYNSFAPFALISFLNIMFMLKKSKIKNIIMSLFFITIMLSGSRMVFIITLIILFVIYIDMKVTKKKLFKKTLITLISVLILFTVLTNFSQIVEWAPSFSRYINVVEKKTYDNFARAELFYIPFRAGKYLLGFGPTKYGTSIAYEGNREAASYFSRYSHMSLGYKTFMDNNYASLLGQYGVIYLIFYFLFMFNIYLKMRKIKFLKYLIIVIILLPITTPIFSVDLFLSLLGISFIIGGQSESSKKNISHNNYT